MSASATGLTPAFADAARDAHRYMKSDLVPAVGTARFPIALAASRGKLKAMQLKVVNATDQGVWLILTMVNVKIGESNAALEFAAVTRQSSSEAQSAAQDVTDERNQCMAEAEGWLSGSSSKVAALNAGPCLKQARLAAAVLGR